MTTSTKIILDMGSGLSIRSGASGAITDVHPRCAVGEVITGGVTDRKYATLEPDMWLLDGSFHFIPDPADIGILSGTITGGAGAFSSPPVLVITFDADYDLTTGIGLTFSQLHDVYADDVDIVFKNSVGGTITSDSYAPDTYRYFCELPSTPISNVRSIEITFNGLNANYRHLRLLRVAIDTLVFEGGEIQQALLTEEIDPISLSMPANTFEFEVLSDSPDFDVVDPGAQYENLQYKNPVEVYEVIDGSDAFMGKFYLQSWESLSPYKARFTTGDAIWLLGETAFRGGIWWVPAPLNGFYRIDIEDLLDDIIEDVAGLTYTIDAALTGQNQIGVLDSANCREALQQILFAIGAYADCSRSSSIKIQPTLLATDIIDPDLELDPEDMLVGSSPKLRSLVTGVELRSQFMTSNTSPPSYIFFDGTFTTGTYYISYDIQAPIWDWIATPASDPDWSIDGTVKFGTVELVVTSASESVKLELAEIADINKVLYTEYATGLPSGTTPNIIVIDDAAFIHETVGAGGPTENASDAVARVFDYFQQRVVFNVRVPLPDADDVNLLSAEVGNSIDVFPLVGTQEVYGIIEKMSTDLAGGFVSDMKIVGYPI